MEVEKYEKQKNGKYKVYLTNGEVISLYEDVILDNKLLLDKEIDMDKLLKDNNYYELYNKCVKYISIRLRSIKEIKTYLNKLNVSIEISNSIIDKLIYNRLLNDNEFTRCFINDKIMFSTMGEYRIKNELKKHDIDDDIISKYINLVDKKIIFDKINKLISKYIKSKNKYSGFVLKNKIFVYLNSLGFKKEDINSCLNNYKF